MDLVFIVIGNRLLEGDVKLAKLAKNAVETGCAVAFVRSKSDMDLDNAAQRKSMYERDL